MKSFIIKNVKFSADATFEDVRRIFPDISLKEFREIKFGKIVGKRKKK